MTGFILRRNILPSGSRRSSYGSQAPPGQSSGTRSITTRPLTSGREQHSALIVRNNVGETGATLLSDGNAGATTASNNYGNQTLTSTGALTAGSPAINGATDGSDAGALDYP